MSFREASLSRAPQAPRVLLAGYDGTSRVPGTSLGAEPLWHALQQAAGRAWPACSIGEQSKNSALWCRRIRAQARATPIRLALGGEHSITFPLLEALSERHPSLRLVVLDAHHDAYDYPLLTHYTVLHYACHDLGIPTLIVGARHELEQMPNGCRVITAERLRRNPAAVQCELQDFVRGAPFYLSLDVDVLEPGDFPAVSSPVEGGPSVLELTQLCRALLELQPLAADIVEYNPLRDSPDGECLRRLVPVLVEVARWLD
jgi:arginase family enzyme